VSVSLFFWKKVSEIYPVKADICRKVKVVFSIKNADLPLPQIFVEGSAGKPFGNASFAFHRLSLKSGLKID